MELAQRRVMVIGMGVSGTAAARFLAARGASLVMVDRRDDLPSRALPAGEFHCGPDDPRWLEGVELVVVSPGVRPDTLLLQTARRQQLPIIGELELAARFLAAPVVAITGTNGKSTVTTLVGEILRAAGMKTFVGGNLGTPLIDAVGQALDAAVVEVSSYQLETIVAFKPHVAIHLNLSPDHLDRYAGLAEYAAAKARIFANQTTADWAILNREDPEVWRLAPELRATVIAFGRTPPPERPAVWLDAEAVRFELGCRTGAIDLARFSLPGDHNRINAAAAAAAALAMCVEPRTIAAALAAFRGLPHRLEFVREHRGVRYVDDSKGTNVGATLEALAATPAPIILIAGGVDKGGSYQPLVRPIADKVMLVILIGAARERMRAALHGAAPLECVATLPEAVALAAARAPAGATVLLSPACSSFDQFKDYAERGRLFQELVRAL